MAKTAYNKDQSIMAQNAATGAVRLVAAIIEANPAHPTTAESALALFDRVRVHIYNGSMTLAGGVPDAVATPESPGDLTFNYGKNKGKTIAECHAEDPTYITWVIDKGSNEYMRDACKAFLAV